MQSGPYRFSRNPIYLAFSVLVLGIACWLNRIWLLGTLAVAVSLMSFVVISREEHYLERGFGAKYLGYKSEGAPLVLNDRPKKGLPAEPLMLLYGMAFVAGLCSS